MCKKRSDDGRTLPPPLSRVFFFKLVRILKNVLISLILHIENACCTQIINVVSINVFLHFYVKLFDIFDYWCLSKSSNKFDIICNNGTKIAKKKKKQLPT